MQTDSTSMISREIISSTVWRVSFCDLTHQFCLFQFVTQTLLLRFVLLYRMGIQSQVITKCKMWRRSQFTVRPKCSCRSNDRARVTRWNTDGNTWHENSTCPIILTSSFGCRTSGILDIFNVFPPFFTIPHQKQDEQRFRSFACSVTCW